MSKTIPLSEIQFRKDLYPRKEHNQQRAQEYSESVDELPPIEINQDRILIDGRHRMIAHELAGKRDIKVSITQTESEANLFLLCIDRNARHGFQMTRSEKRTAAKRAWCLDKNVDKDHLAKTLGVARRSVFEWLSDDCEKQALDDLRPKYSRILELHLRGWTQTQIASDSLVQESQQEVDRKLALLLQSAESHSNLKAVERKAITEVLASKSAGFDDFKVPIYNVWTYGKLSNSTEHFGNTEQQIVENLIYLFTDPWDTVLDPFAGGGSTLDVCSRRLRRCYLSDLHPKPGMEDKITPLDVAQSLPRPDNWDNVGLTYLDPPYWWQAKGEYSDSDDDLANMPLEKFTSTMVGIVKRFAAKQSRGAIALIIQPTQWRSPDREFTDHVFDIVSGVSSCKKLKLWNRISCPYSTEQCTPQMVDWAKDNKSLLVLSRELIVWRII